MKITNKNITWIILILFNISILWLLSTVIWDMNNISSYFAGLTLILTIFLNIGLITNFIINCSLGQIKFEYEIPIPFISYFKYKQKCRELNLLIDNVKIEIGKCVDDAELNKLYKKLKVLQGINLNELI